jgi:8-oxo-dGTP diphosphatase/putative hydrolase of the HAD superfamily
MSHSIRWIFFDVGYTLLDETPAWADQFTRLSRALGQRGRDVPVERIWSAYRECCVHFAPRQWKAVVERFAPAAADVESLLALATGWRHDLETPFPHADAVLAELARHWRLGVIANQSLGTRNRMEQHGLLRHLSVIIGSAEAGVAKPDPRIFQAALAEAGCEPRQAVMVGDRIDNDIRPANVLGMKTVHVRQGGSGGQLARDGNDVPTASIDHLYDLTPQRILGLG